MLHWEHSAILSTFIKLSFVNKFFVLSIFEWPLKTGFTVIAVFPYHKGLFLMERIQGVVPILKEN